MSLRWTIGLVTVFLVLLGGAIASWYWEPAEERVTAGPPGSSPPRETPERSPGPLRSVMLYFASPRGDRLEPETREIPIGNSVGEEMRQVMTELAEGSSGSLAPTLPPGTRVRSVFVDTQGTAYVDFERALQENHPGGAGGELLTVYSIVDTLAANFDHITRVQILVGGERVTTLAGHVDIRQPLSPRFAFDSGASEISPWGPTFR